MTKKKQHKQQVHQLSTNEYIKTKVRLLPIYKSYINSDWYETGLVTIIVARIHPTGNFTFGIYIIESNKRGLILSRIQFSKTEYELEDFKEHMVKKENEYHIIVEIDYDLAHNIIYQSIALAKTKGYNPDKEFNLSKYILKEDNDEIKKFEIDFENNEMRIEYELENERLKNIDSTSKE